MTIIFADEKINISMVKVEEAAESRNINFRLEDLSRIKIAHFRLSNRSVQKKLNKIVRKKHVKIKTYSNYII